MVLWSPLYLQDLPFTMIWSFLLSSKPAYMKAGEKKSKIIFLASNYIIRKKAQVKK